MKYIATRPRAERLSDHGLFGDEDGVNLEKAMRELDQYTGNVWTHIISLKREDAARLGYDNAKAWMNLLRANRNDIAAAMNIPPNHFRWYAAYHDSEVENYYHGKSRERKKLSQEKEFRQIKNSVIQEAERIRLGEITFEDADLTGHDEPERLLGESYACWELRQIIRDDPSPWPTGTAQQRNWNGWLSEATPMLST